MALGNRQLAMTPTSAAAKARAAKVSVALRAFAFALPGAGCDAPRFVATGSGPGRAGSSDNAALCPGQTIAAPGPGARDLLRQAIAFLVTAS